MFWCRQKPRLAVPRGPFGGRLRLSLMGCAMTSLKGTLHLMFKGIAAGVPFDGPHLPPRDALPGFSLGVAGKQAI